MFYRIDIQWELQQSQAKRHEQKTAKEMKWTGNIYETCRGVVKVFA